MNDFSFGFRSYRAEPLLHHHDHHQVVLPHRGRLDLEVARRGGVVTQGIVTQGIGAFIVAGARHAFFARHGNSFIVVDLPAGDRPDLQRAAQRFGGSAFFPIGQATQGLLDYLAATIGGEDVPVQVRASWSELLIHSLTNDRSADGDQTQRRLDRAINFMRVGMAQTIGVADIAAACGLSQTRLHALFRSRMGISPHAVLIRLRLEAARRLLVRTNLSIAEIAVRTGHTDQSALTRRLRVADGVTPAALRRMLRDRGEFGGSV